MSRPKRERSSRKVPTVAGRDPLFEQLADLDRLEELLEELNELGVTTVAELEHRIQELERRIADIPEPDNGSV